MEESDKKQLTIRIDKNLFEKVQRIAKNENRALNGQIEYIIKKYLELRGE